MGVSLYTSRMVLNTLGVEDFGIYNIVGGVIVMFSFLNTSMSGATSRFLTFELGRGDYEKLKKTFSAALTIHFIIAGIILVLGETIGLWWLENKLVVAPDRMPAARWVYQLSILSSMITITQVPYNATIIAHERMSVYAYVEILNSFLKLGIVYLLVIGNFDKLILYAVLTLCVTVIITTIYKIYCTRNFSESHYKFAWEKEIIKPMISFSGWNLFGSSASVLKNQGVNILLNIFFGPIVNAANAIAYQVNSAVSNFSNGFTTALTPQIVKSYATKDIARMKKLIFRGGRYIFFLLMILMIPIFLETDIILRLWLKNVPQYTAELTKLVLILTLTDSFMYTTGGAIQATGKNKYFQSTIATITLFVLPLSYICLKIDANPLAPLMVSIILSVIALFSRLFFLRKYIGIAIKEYFKYVLLVVSIVLLLSIFPPFVLHRLMATGFLRLIVVVVASLLSSMFFIYFIGLTNEEKNKVIVYVRNIKNKFF